MVIDLQALFNLIAGAAITVIGWFFKNQWDGQRELAKDLKEIEINLPLQYVRRDEYTQTMLEIKSMFSRISDKLDMKADK
jgi:hypothetical protein